MSKLSCQVASFSLFTLVLDHQNLGRAQIKGHCTEWVLVKEGMIFEADFKAYPINS
jgi:hypothetical protein